MDGFVTSLKLGLIVENALHVSHSRFLRGEFPPVWLKKGVANMNLMKRSGEDSIIKK